MEYKNLMYYLGLGLIILLILHFVVRTLNFQAKLVEGMVNNNSVTTDKDKIPDAIKNHTETKDDKLLIDKYRRSYEHTIINLEENIGKEILTLLNDNAEMLAKDCSSDNSQKIVAKLNSLVDFKKTLNEAMQTLDKN